MKRKEKQFELDFNPPQMKEDPDFTILKNTCKHLIDDLKIDGRYDEDYDSYIFEAAMEACFGKDVWKWIREHRHD